MSANKKTKSKSTRRQPPSLSDYEVDMLMTEETKIAVPSQYETEMTRYLATLLIRDREAYQTDTEDDEKTVIVRNGAKRVPDRKLRESKHGEAGEEEEDDEDTGSAVEVSAVTDHRVDEKGNWHFRLRFKGFRDTEWVADKHCDCEKLIREYLATKRISTVYGICRVSSKNQAGPTHVSLQAQEFRLRNTASEMYGNKCRVKIYKMSTSVYKGIPALFQYLAEEVFQNGDTVLIYRVDRLCRNIIKFLAFLENLNEKGVKIYAQDEKLWYGENRLQFIQGIVDANKEAELISKRVRMSIEQRKNRGDDALGSVPYGWTLVREEKTNRLVKVQHMGEQKILKRLYLLAQSMQPEDVADQLNSENLKKKGRKWTKAMVKRILQNM